MSAMKRPVALAIIVIAAATSAASADDTVFDFVAPRADQVGNYEPGTGGLVSGGIATLLPINGWFDGDWAYRLPLSLDNPNAAALSEWPLGLLVDAASDSGYHLFHLARPTGADLRVVNGTNAIDLLSFGHWDLAANWGRLWFQLPSLAAGVSSYYLYFGNPTAAAIDLPQLVFAYSAPYASRYALEPAAATMVIASMSADNDYATGLSSGTLGSGEIAAIDTAAWGLGQGIAATDPIDVGFDVNTGAEAAPVSFARLVHSVVVNRGASNEFRMIAPLGNATVTVSVDGVVTDTVDLTAGIANTYASDIANDAVITFAGTTPIMVAHRSDDLNDGYVLPPPAAEVWGVRSGTPRIVAVTTQTDVVIYSSAGTTTTATIAAGAALALTASTGSGDGDALRIVASATATGAPAPITVLSNGDGDGGDAMVFHPASELGRSWVIPTDATFALVAITRPGASCVLTPPGGGPATTVAAPVTPPPPFPQRIKFGANSGNNIAAGSLITCDAHGFAYYEDFVNEDERNLYPMESHRKVAASEPGATLGDDLQTRYTIGFTAIVDTPDAVAPTAVVDWTDFRVAVSEPARTSIKYQLSIDSGTTWLAPSSGNWIVAPDLTFGGDAAAVRAALANLDTSTGKVRVRVLLTTIDGVTRPEVDAIRIFYDSTGSADRLRWDPLPLTVIAGVSVAAVITAIDNDGTTITGISGEVALTSTHSGQLLPGTVTMSGGRALFNLKLTGAADDVTIRAYGPTGLVGVSSTFDLVSPAGATLEYVSGSDQFGLVSTLLGEPLVVRVVDESSTPIGGVQVTFAVLEGGGALEPGGAATAAITDDAGLARAWLRLGDTPGAQRVLAEGAAAEVEFVARADEGGASADEGCCSIDEPRAPRPATLFLALLVAVMLGRRRR